MVPITSVEMNGTSSAALETAVDAYAIRVLRRLSPPEAVVDESVGPYVTSLLRCADISSKDEVTKLPEFESLLELLEDQCSMENESATQAVLAIATAVCTGTIPSETRSRSASFGVFTTVGVQTRKRSQSFGLYSGGGLDSFKSMSDTSSKETSSEDVKFDSVFGEPFTPIQVGAPSPMKMEALVPVDLLGALNNPSPHISRIGGHAHFREAFEQQQQKQEQELTQRNQQEQEQEKESDDGKKSDSPSDDGGAFPTLSAATSASVKKQQAPEKMSRGRKGSKTHTDPDLAAALFRPARTRANSVDVEDNSACNSKSATQPSNTALHSAPPGNQFFKQQLDSCVEILLSMNHDLSEEAAREAGFIAKGDINIAQYVVDAAMTAKPVCRHMLHGGCYRSDCQFSHDVEGHTCLFWLRGRCGKGSTCRFLHGFNPKLVENIPSRSQAPQQVFSGDFGPLPAASTPTMDSSSASSHGMKANRTPTSVRTNLEASSFANIASKGYSQFKFASPTSVASPKAATPSALPTVRIPQDLWNPHENRDATFFHIPDPIERYTRVSASVKRRDVIDLHFQSTKTFSAVLARVLPNKLSELHEVWIVTGTGHHVGSKTHQKGGGALERAVTTWLVEEGYNCYRGRDRNGLGGALLVKR
ncbi:unnamed protein product [Cylindrotheca closterium]|uniref:C3H1-type domain-containing protein n=1 Tax=Cylindrotheca closterium TaxID=2856 RepID=A0AAD2FYT4_9STRA|nr:unnamed protein product [Cylindrotheca closterium]